jgi:hypothetical protein
MKLASQNLRSVHVQCLLNVMAVLPYIYAHAPPMYLARLPSNFTVVLQRGQALPVSGMSPAF